LAVFPCARLALPASVATTPPCGAAISATPALYRWLRASPSLAWSRSLSLSKRALSPPGCLRQAAHYLVIVARELSKHATLWRSHFCNLYPLSLRGSGATEAIYTTPHHRDCFGCASQRHPGVTCLRCIVLNSLTTRYTKSTKKKPSVPLVCLVVKKAIF